MEGWILTVSKKYVAVLDGFDVRKLASEALVVERG